ncbi:MAG: hypothetical protein OEY89_09680, partial [Gammaproteobacteria bacterium]|nr:hypothetical protein [Gammaproteobacteria bacterium]
KVENCAPANNVCVIEFNGKSIGFHLPNDAAYLKDFPVEVHLHGFAEQQIKSAQLDFIMPGMNMGLNRIRLQERNFQLWSGTGKLAVCLSRRTDWLAKVMLNIDNNIYQAEFLFKVDINN